MQAFFRRQAALWVTPGLAVAQLQLAADNFARNFPASYGLQDSFSAMPLQD
jgi:hypothetical protein